MNVLILILLIGLLGSKEHKKPKGPPEALRPKLQPTQQQARSRRSAYAPGDGSKYPPILDPRLEALAADLYALSRYANASTGPAILNSEASHLMLLPPLNSQTGVDGNMLLLVFLQKLQISAGREDRGFRNMNGELWYPSENAGKLPAIKHTQKKGYQWQSYLMKVKTVKDGSIQGRVQPVRVHVTLAPEFLDISNNLFSSSLSDGIGKFDSLQNLSLAGNNFSGPIPNSISEMSSIKSLDLSRNALSGALPQSLTKLGSFVSLIVSRNGFTEKFPEVSCLFPTLINLTFTGICSTVL
ncbi:hypothetical protein KIW84_014057 [Lathyrus oleraceus]|uniref:Uncharacterized protein n=1 Tax=Pisum sativum TaxID=3888 RepID=A0A9D5GYX9_PEA|nr:hypothetical protein KIW84_014057 [Pisum sativum]